MNEEIKESIKYIQDIVDFYKLNDENNYDYSDKDLISMKTLLNYITNLQEENNLLKAKIKCMEEITGHNQKQPKDESEIYNEMFR